MLFLLLYVRISRANFHVFGQIHILLGSHRSIGFLLYSVVQFSDLFRRQTGII